MSAQSIAVTPVADRLRGYAQHTVEFWPGAKGWIQCRYPEGRISRCLPISTNNLLTQNLPHDVIVELDKLSVNEFWFALLLQTLLRPRPQLDDLTPALVREAAEWVRDTVRNTKKYGQLLAEVNTGQFRGMDEDDLREAKAYGLIVTDETWPFPDDQDRINPIFCL
ncbi:MAG: hypothetical protein ACRD3W_31285 [Terriglobales bacterium]